MNSRGLMDGSDILFYFVGASSAIFNLQFYLVVNANKNTQKANVICVLILVIVVAVAVAVSAAVASSAKFA